MPIVTAGDSARLTLRAIEVFVAVVEEGSVAAGARRLGASASTVSQQLSNLETALGARLIDRAARPAAPTPAGHVFQRRALAILGEAARARTELAELALARLPRLRLAVVEDFDAAVTPDLAIGLAAILPDCAIVAQGGPSHLNIAALEARAVDLVVAARIASAPDWVEQHALLRDPYVLVAARGLLGAGGDPLARLMAAPLVRYTATQLMGQQIEAHLSRLRLSPPRRFAFDTDAAVMATVARTGGWAITTPLGFLRGGRGLDALELRPLPFSGFARTLSLYARRDLLGGLPARAAALLRRSIAEHCVGPARAAAPWLAEEIRVLDEAEAPA